MDLFLRTNSFAGSLVFFSHFFFESIPLLVRLRIFVFLFVSILSHLALYLLVFAVGEFKLRAVRWIAREPRALQPVEAVTETGRPKRKKE